MKRPIKVFEPVTNEQIKLLHSAPLSAHENEWSKAMLYEKVVGLIGIPFISALSRQEAALLIDQLKGKTMASHPARQAYEDEIQGDASKLPSAYHIKEIRDMLRELAWDKKQITNWLLKYRKVKNIRTMDREQARDTRYALSHVVANIGRTSVEL